MRHHLPDQAHLLRPLSADAVAEEQQLHGVLPADALGHAHRALDRGHPDRDLGETELGALAGDDEVAGRDQGQGEPETVAVDRGDHGLPDLHAALEGSKAGDLPERTPGLAGRAAQVGAGAERAARAGDDGHVGLFVLAESQPGVIEILAQLAVDGVERLGTVVGNCGDTAVAFVQDCAGHVPSLLG